MRSVKGVEAIPLSNLQFTANQNCTRAEFRGEDDSSGEKHDK
jgi:hypothetical protein